MQLIDKLVRNFLARPLARIDRFVATPYDTQEQTLMRLVRKAKNTEWGKKYNYNRIKSYADYQRQVPISSYEALYPYIERMLIKGEQNLLWSSPVRWFSKSSGTTNARSKFIPVSPEALQTCHLQGGKDMLALYIKNNPETRFFWGRGLSIGGSFQKNPDNPNNYYGDISAVIVQNLPGWAEWLRTPPRHIAMMTKWEDKIEAMVTETSQRNVTSLLGVPTWTIVLIQSILERYNKKTIEEVWPNLEVFIHGAVSFKPYRELFKSLAPSIRYLETYNASEGFFGLQDDISREDMLLMLDYEVFFEFVPMSELGKEQPQAVAIDQVELHKNYALVISTNAGLWRYLIGDTVKFTSKNPYRVQITGRTKHFINAFGEEVIIENAEAAITRACQATEAVISDYTAAPLYMEGKNQGGHEWAIEFEKSPQNLAQFTDVLDQTLREVNSDYDAKRYKDIALKKPVIHHLPEGTFYRWLKKRGKLGGQNKVPRLSNNREYLEDILGMLDNSQLAN